MATGEQRKREFVENTFGMLRSTLSASCLAFYSVDQEDNLHDFICDRVPREFFRHYIGEMHRIDPLHVRCFTGRSDRVARMDQAPDYDVPAETICEYTRFLRRHGIVDNIDLLFRHEGRIKAGLSVMWTARDPAPADETFRVADSLQPYIEYTLWDHVDAPRIDVMARAIKVFHLTPREADVVKLLCVGRTNADIAECLGIGIATVKTHLIKVFDKTGAENRSGLVARMSAFA